MKLYFLRHAKAYPRSPRFNPDSKRPLTPQGEEKMREAALGIRKLELSFGVILTSPYVRALKTAEIAADLLKCKKLVQTENLISEADPHKLIEELNDRYSSLDGIILVGHEPFMSRLMSLLLTGAPDLAMDFKKAGLCCLSVERLKYGKCACLEWLLTPKQLAQIGH